MSLLQLFDINKKKEGFLCVEGNLRRNFVIDVAARKPFLQPNY
jgi:hypothetical protein